MAERGRSSNNSSKLCGVHPAKLGTTAEIQIIGADLHTRQQTVVMLNAETGQAYGFKLILFFLGILSGIGYAFDSLGRRIHSLFPPIVAVNILGHVDIHVTQNVMHERRRCAFAQHRAGMHGAEAPKILFIARIGRVRISAKAAC